MITFRHTPEDYIINISEEIPYWGYIVNDFMLSALKIRNSSESTIELQSIRFRIEHEGKALRIIEFQKEIFKERMNELFRYTPIEEQYPGGLVAYFGVENFWNLDDYVKDLVLEPNQETGFCFEHFKFTDTKLADRLIITLIFDVNGSSSSESYVIPIKQYKNKNQYQFPLKGNWFISGNHHSLWGHRRSCSQEFGWDAIKHDKNLQPYPKGIKNEDVHYYKTEVHAIADGEVVDCYNRLPENPDKGTKLLDDPSKVPQLVSEHGIPTVGTGNFVYIRHAGEEYSFYAHFATNSLKVKKGDKVKQGQVIGLMGNSGNSNSIHLHFHMTSGPNPFIGRGFPCQFTNVYNDMGEKLKHFENDGQLIYAKDS